MDLVDLHSHLLPDVDDGPSTLEETVDLLRAAHGAGVRRIVATPHMFLDPWNHRDPAPIRDAFARTRAALEQRAKRDASSSFLDDLTIELGAENYASPELLAAVEKDRVLTLNDSRYLLIEFPILLPAATILTVLGRILDAGKVPVVAHVERYRAFHERPEQLETLRDGGAVLQVNAQSLLADRNGSLRRRCIDLLRRGTVQVVASDVHGAALGRPHLGAVLAGLSSEVPAEVLRAAFSDTPRRIVNDEALA